MANDVGRNLTSFSERNKIIDFLRRRNMGETKKGTSFFQSLKSEFKKIIWPNKERLTKEASVVIVVSIILGILIAILDMVLQYGIQFIIK